MSRIGKKLIDIPSGVTVVIEGQNITVSGPRGELKREIHRDILVENSDGKISVTPKRELSKREKGLWGLYRALIANMVEGVEKGFEIKLEIEGVGYKAEVQGDELVLNLGFENPVKIKKTDGINFATEKGLITVTGIEKEKVGEVSALIRRAKKAEPYKGKGIKYQGEKIRRKEGKKVVSSK